MNGASLAQPHDRDQLKALWKTAFTDDDEKDIDCFFECFLNDRSCLVMRDNDRIVSMLFLPETAIVTPHRRYPVGYIYAGATLPSARGKGYYRRLLTFAKEEAKRRGLCALLLRPATSSLTESYRRMGFTVPLYCDESVCSTVPTVTETPLSAAAFTQMRRRLLTEKQQPFVDWDERVISYALRWCYAAAYSPSCCALYAQDDDGMRVWDKIGDAPVGGKDGADCRCRTVGNTTLTALLCPVDETVPDTVWGTVYFGYGLE